MTRSRLAVASATLLTLSLLVACSGTSEQGGQAPAAPPPETGPATSSPAAPAAQNPIGGSASVSGTVSFEGQAPKLKPLRMDADPGCMKKHAEPVLPEVLVLGDDNRMANVFVQVKSGLPDVRFPAPADPVVLNQNGCQYTPHVTGVMVDQVFKILNSDGLLHNVHSLPQINTPFNRAMPAAVTEVEYTFSKPESMFKIKCDVHPWMNAYVAVMSHPYFAVTGEDGAFSLSGLPAGTYEIEAWHERLGTQSTSVTVADGQAAEVAFTFEMGS